MPGRCLEGNWKVSRRCLESVWKGPGKFLQVCKYAILQVCKCGASMQVSKYITMQVCKCASVQFSLKKKSYEYASE